MTSELATMASEDEKRIVQCNFCNTTSDTPKQLSFVATENGNCICEECIEKCRDIIGLQRIKARGEMI